MMHKKFLYLLASTMLASGLGASSAFAESEAPTLTVNGHVMSDWVHSSQSKNYRGPDSKGHSRSDKMRAESDLRFNIHAATDDFKYGARMTLETDWKGKDDDPRTKDAYIFLESDMGRVELGSVESASKRMEVGATSLAAATGGIDGDWQNFFNTDVRKVINHAYDPTTLDGMKATHAEFHLEPSLATDQTDMRTNRVSLYSPRWNGWQVGVSFAPDAGDKGRLFTGKYSDDVYKDSEPDAFGVENLTNAAISYDGCIQEVRVTASAIGGFGHTEKDKNSPSHPRRFKDMRAYGGGLMLNYSGFSLAGSYVHMGNSLAEKVTAENSKAPALIADPTNYRYAVNKSHYWTLGGAYTQGPATVSLTYLQSLRDYTAYAQTSTSLAKDGQLSNRFNNIALSADYKLAPGLTTYAEAFFLDAKSKRKNSAAAAQNNLEKNRGNVVMVGARVDF